MHECMQLVNPSETFGDIVIDYNHVECTSACVTALAAFAARRPAHRAREIAAAIAHAVRYIKRWACVRACVRACVCARVRACVRACIQRCVCVGRAAPPACPLAHPTPLHPPTPPRSIQRPDGSWYGNWAVCFTYGTWFGCEALAAVGETAQNSGGSALFSCCLPACLPCFCAVALRWRRVGEQVQSSRGWAKGGAAAARQWPPPSPARPSLPSPPPPHPPAYPPTPHPPHPHPCCAGRARSACAFLLSKQRPDGGWGESYLSSHNKTYTQLPPGAPSHVVNTAWALLALLASRYQVRAHCRAQLRLHVCGPWLDRDKPVCHAMPCYQAVDRAPLDAAARCLLAQQGAAGDWPQQHISGVFNRSCMISYTNYRYTFPIWALGVYRTQLCDGEA